jgi:hypothetical protein
MLCLPSFGRVWNHTYFMLSAAVNDIRVLLLSLICIDVTVTNPWLYCSKFLFEKLKTCCYWQLINMPTCCKNLKKPIFSTIRPQFSSFWKNPGNPANFVRKFVRLLTFFVGPCWFIRPSFRPLFDIDKNPDISTILCLYFFQFAKSGGVGSGEIYSSTLSLGTSGQSQQVPIGHIGQ